MFTKSQLVATAVLVASASSVVASSMYSDVTEIEARNYNRDALAELKRRAILEYIEELETRELTGVTTGTVAAAVQAHDGKNSQQVSKPVSHQKDTQSTEGSHHGQNTHGHSLTQHRLSGHRLSGSRSSRVKHKKSGQSDKKSSSSTHQHNTQPGVSSASSSSSVKVKGQSTSPSSQQVNKRSVIEYIEDLFGRGPTETTTTSTATKGSQQPIPASNKGLHTSSTNAEKGGEGHGHATKPSNAINEQKGTVARKSGTHKESEGPTKLPSAHHQTQEQGSGKGTKHNVQHGNGLRKNKNRNRNRKQRVLSSSHERNPKTKGLKEPTAHERHRGSSSHASTLTTNGRVTTAGKQSTSSSGQHSSSSNGQRLSSNGKDTPPSDTVSSQQKPNLPPKVPSVKTREIEELAELIARELDLYDDLD